MSTPVRVSELAEQIRGVTYAKEDASAVPRPGYLPILRAGNITDHGLAFDDLVYVPSDRIAEDQMIRKNDILVAASSGSLDVVGKAAAAKGEFNGSFGAFCKVLRPRAGINPAYLAHYFRTPQYRRRVSALAAGANINNLRNEHLDRLQVPLPPIDEQCRIAEILDKADALRAKRRAAIDQLDTLTQSIFLDMFGDPATNPHGFPRLPLAALVRDDDTINYGVVQPGDDLEEGIPLIRVGDLVDGRVRHAQLKRIAPSIESAYQRSRLRGDELLVSCVGSIGVVALADERVRGYNIARAVARIPVTDPTLRTYLAAYLNTAHVQRYFTRELRTVSQPTLNIKQLSETAVMLAPLSLRQQFAQRCMEVDRRKGLYSLSAIDLDALFSSLQDHAFRGAL